MKTRVVEGRYVYLPLPMPEREQAALRGPVRFAPTPKPQYREVILHEWASVATDGARTVFPGAAAVDGGTLYHTPDFPVERWLEARNAARWRTGEGGA